MSSDEERVETSVYLRMNSMGQVNNVTKGKPTLGRDEVAFKVFLSVPASVFRSPIFEAELGVEEGQVIIPVVKAEIEDQGLPE